MMDLPRKYRQRRRIAPGSLAATEVAKVAGCELQVAHKAGVTGYNPRHRKVHAEVAAAAHRGNQAHAEYEHVVRQWGDANRPKTSPWVKPVIIIITVLLGAAVLTALSLT